MYDLRLLKSLRENKVDVSEDQEQVWVFQWAKRNEKKYPGLDKLFHVPNGGHRSKRTATLLKLAGVKRGVPDIFLPVPRGPYCGLWVEMKRLSKSARATKEQREWIDYFNKAGYKAVVCHGFEAARDEILAYLTLGEHE